MAANNPAVGAHGPAAGETQVPLNQERSPVIMNVANYLRGNSMLKMRGGLLNNKEEVDFFRFKRMKRALLSDDYKKKSADGKNQLVLIPNEQEVAKMFVQFILARLLVPVEKLHYHEIKAVKGWVPNRQKPTLRPTTKATLDPDAYYAWTYQKPNPYLVLYGFLMIAAVFAVILFPLWPVFMRIGVWYLSMGCLGLLGLFFAMAIVRLIIFVVTFVALPHAFWLYPNLFADCGFFESFQPLYAWSGPSEKKSKKKRAAAVTQPEAVAQATASGVQKSSGAQGRTVTLEEVDE
ncbi:translocation protein SEC62 [Metschnikowia bicuspidata var. bicuspidata NRRL YB-4993]|uniref:Translocation protein SEC62 n=1 Tax=Metschnikowia bicuspidata var. bicuspidata NRRL YB-4993 TaxID=869754 RepID=A0A1A0HEJ8_9ASCO|nr:translocation protein SEC62 [Metschnikowia bicuspidata var. bicuspidata NRRL YB-4993]OBA22410.1 translocation protein SEC62 [Metschnikowia bicuspidata var. bicuspidata NRRL YB-4993]